MEITSESDEDSNQHERMREAITLYKQCVHRMSILNSDLVPLGLAQPILTIVSFNVFEAVIDCVK